MDKLSQALIEFEKSYIKILENVQSPLQEIIKSVSSVVPKIDVPMQTLIEHANQVSNMYSEALDSERMQQNLKSISDIIIKTEGMLTGIDVSEFTSSQKEDIKIAEDNLNEVNQIVISPSSKTLSWEQWIAILGIILQLLSTIKDFLPNNEFEMLQSQVEQVIDETQDYYQHSLENQSLFLENQDKMIENQELILQNQDILIDLQNQSQFDSQQSD